VRSHPLVSVFGCSKRLFPFFLENSNHCCVRSDGKPVVRLAKWRTQSSPFPKAGLSGGYIQYVNPMVYLRGFTRYIVRFLWFGPVTGAESILAIVYSFLFLIWKVLAIIG